MPTPAFFTVDCAALERRGWDVRCFISAEGGLDELRLERKGDDGPDSSLPRGFMLREATCEELLRGITRAVAAAVQTAETDAAGGSEAETEDVLAAQEEMLRLDIQRNLTTFESQWHRARPHAELWQPEESVIPAPEIRVHGVGATCAEVTWFVPGPPGSLPDVEHFELEVSAYAFGVAPGEGLRPDGKPRDPKRHVVAMHTIAGDLRSTMVQGLRPSRLHKLRMRSVGPGATRAASPWSEEATATTPVSDAPVQKKGPKAFSTAEKALLEKHGLLGAGEAAQRVDAQREAQRSSPLRSSAGPKVRASSSELKGLLDQGFGPASAATTTRTVLDARSARGLSDYMSMGSVGRPAENRDERKERMRQVLLATEFRDQREMTENEWHMGPLYSQAEPVSQQ